MCDTKVTMKLGLCIKCKNFIGRFSSIDPTIRKFKCELTCIETIEDGRKTPNGPIFSYNFKKDEWILNPSLQQSDLIVPDGNQTSPNAKYISGKDSEKGGRCPHYLEQTVLDYVEVKKTSRGKAIYDVIKTELNEIKCENEQGKKDGRLELPYFSNEEKKFPEIKKYTKELKNLEIEKNKLERKIVKFTKKLLKEAEKNLQKSQN